MKPYVIVLFFRKKKHNNTADNAEKICKNGETVFVDHYYM